MTFGDLFALILPEYPDFVAHAAAAEMADSEPDDAAVAADSFYSGVIVHS